MFGRDKKNSDFRFWIDEDQTNVQGLQSSSDSFEANS